MDMDFELLRRDLTAYVSTALPLGLPCVVKSETEVTEADEAGLVSIAADQGWDLGKYVRGAEDGVRPEE